LTELLSKLLAKLGSLTIGLRGCRLGLLGPRFRRQAGRFCSLPFLR
jgi:hypothetical protein